MLRRTPVGSDRSSNSRQSHGINLQMIDQANSFLNAAADDSKKSFIANQLTPWNRCTNFESECRIWNGFSNTSYLGGFSQRGYLLCVCIQHYLVQYVWVFPFPQNKTRLQPPTHTHTPTRTIQDQILEQKDACVLEELVSKEVCFFAALLLLILSISCMPPSFLTPFLAFCVFPSLSPSSICLFRMLD
jgi:hypothetical protein